MQDDTEFWDFYWETRLQPMENLGKREAILAASRLILQLSRQCGRPLRVLEPGCGEGQVVGTLVDGLAQYCAVQDVVGIDYLAQSIARCRRDFPGMQFWEGDFTDPALLGRLGQYDLLLLVNALHEVFSAGYSEELGEVDVPAAKQHVEQALAGLVEKLVPGGWLLLFDGLEPPGDPSDELQIRFLDRQVRDDFETFAREYVPFRITYRETGQPFSVELSRRDFTRYITKSIFLRKQLWQSERKESYQYFTEAEFRSVYMRLGLKITQLRVLTMNDVKWRRQVEIVTPGVKFPHEHILIIAQRSVDGSGEMAFPAP